MPYNNINEENNRYGNLEVRAIPASLHIKKEEIVEKHISAL